MGSMYYLRLLILVLWGLFATVLLLAISPLTWKNPRLNYWFGRILYFMGPRIMGWKPQYEGLENLTKYQPCIYVSNHQSNLDVITYSGAFPPNTVVIGKKELRWVPFFGAFFVGGSNILIDRKNKRDSIGALSTAADVILKRRASIWMFPEGTRNKGSLELLPFKKGAFHLAITTQCPIVALVHEPLQNYFQEGTKQIIPGKIRIKILPPYFTEGLTKESTDELAMKIRNDMQTTLRAISNSK